MHVRVHRHEVSNDYPKVLRPECHRRIDSQVSGWVVVQLLDRCDGFVEVAKDLQATIIERQSVRRKPD